MLFWDGEEDSYSVLVISFVVCVCTYVCDGVCDNDRALKYYTDG